MCKRGFNAGIYLETSKFPRRGPGIGGSLCLIHCCVEAILSRTMLNISYDRYKTVFLDDTIYKTDI